MSRDRVLDSLRYFKAKGDENMTPQKLAKLVKKHGWNKKKIEKGGDMFAYDAFRQTVKLLTRGQRKYDKDRAKNAGMSPVDPVKRKHLAAILQERIFARFDQDDDPHPMTRDNSIAEQPTLPSRESLDSLLMVRADRPSRCCCLFSL